VTLNPSIHLPHGVIIRAPGLLPMWYRPAELADDLGIALSTLRDWLAQGAPHECDASGHIWINGRGFADWVEAVRKEKKGRPKQKLDDGQAWCLRCDKPVALATPSRRQHGRLVLLSGACPECGTKINRGGRHG